MSRKLTVESFTYPKFKSVGDIVEGRFESFQLDVPNGQYNPRDVLILSPMDPDGPQLLIGCPTVLSKIIQGNLRALHKGIRIKITFTGTSPSAKGSPTKLFDVDLPDAPEEAAPVDDADDDDDISFPEAPKKVG